MGGKRFLLVLVCAIGLQAAHAQDSDPAQFRAQWFGEEPWIDNAMVRARALPSGQISTAGTDVFQSLETTRDVFTFVPLKVSFPTAFETCRLALASNRNLNGIRTAYLCDAPQTSGFINLMATREDAAQTQEAFVVFAENNLRNEAFQIFGVSGDHSFCKPRAPNGRFASALVCELQFTHASARSSIPATYRKVFAWSGGVVVSSATACAGAQCETALPDLDRFVHIVSIAP